ncbi:MAG: DUF2723 domain-containing protein, partial [Tannerellaceae bacterium]|nr:DUF2723 domain-containing protein [Tannerellaceae bacterium]
EVYAYSSLFTAVVFWLILKWEDVAGQAHADRWIVLIAYLMGVSIGVHLLNLLCIPAIVLVYYYNRYPNPTMKGTIVALLISFAIIGLIMLGLVQGLAEVCGWFELFFVNTLGMPYNSGVFVYILLLAGIMGWTIWETMRENLNPVRIKIAFLLSIVLLGIPFMGNGYFIGVLLIAALAAYLFMRKTLAVKTLNMIMICLMVAVVGYSSYALIFIRATADTPMNQNNPSDIFTLRSYLAREQYGSVPLLYGNTYVSEYKREVQGNMIQAVTKKGKPVYHKVIKKDENEKDRYFVSRHEQIPRYMNELEMLFPRMYSRDGNHINAYKEWGQVKGAPVRIPDLSSGETRTVMKPTFAENIRFFFHYQLNFMYWRYFMWNFSGRQNDIQGQGEILHGNWITGIKFIDEVLIGPQEDMPNEIANNKGHNVYYMLPFLLGILGLLFQAYSGKNGIQGFWITFFLFFMTGIAIVLYLNQSPLQVRERDYAYAGSFYAFSIWIGFGVAAVAKALEQYTKAPAVVAASLATLLCLFVPIQVASQNWDDHDRSGRTVARDFGRNYLESCEPNAILFTNGDNDTFPLWYAQEVEGIRTDVRVCNTSYLQTDWYIDQMKKGAYESAPLPITWNRSDYIQGTRDIVYLFPMLEQVDLKNALNFARSNNPETRKTPYSDQEMDFIPTHKLVFPVDKEAVLQNGVVEPEKADQILDTMVVDLSGKDALVKNELIILDMLQANNWKRPMYYALTVSSDQWVNLDKYFRLTGLANQIVPMSSDGEAGNLNTGRMYDNLMNKFQWGGVDKPGVYLDEQVMRMCKTYRTALFSRLAEELIAEGQPEKALSVLDKAMEVLPVENIPMDYSGLSFGQLYYELDESEKAEEILAAIADNSLRNLNWFFRLKPGQIPSVIREMELNLQVMSNIIYVSKRYNPEFAAKYQEEFDNYRMAYGSMMQQDRGVEQ